MIDRTDAQLLEELAGKEIFKGLRVQIVRCLCIDCTPSSGIAPTCIKYIIGRTGIIVDYGLTMAVDGNPITDDGVGVFGGEVTLL